MIEYCETCEKTTEHRYLDCSECKDKGETCPIIVCVDCGATLDSRFKLKMEHT